MQLIDFQCDSCERPERALVLETWLFVHYSPPQAEQHSGKIVQNKEHAGKINMNAGKAHVTLNIYLVDRLCAHADFEKLLEAREGTKRLPVSRVIQLPPGGKLRPDHTILISLDPWDTSWSLMSGGSQRPARIEKKIKIDDIASCHKGGLVVQAAQFMLVAQGAAKTDFKAWLKFVVSRDDNTPIRSSRMRSRSTGDLWSSRSLMKLNELDGSKKETEVYLKFNLLHFQKPSSTNDIQRNTGCQNFEVVKSYIADSFTDLTKAEAFLQYGLALHTTAVRRICTQCHRQPQKQVSSGLAQWSVGRPGGGSVWELVDCLVRPGVGQHLLAWSVLDQFTSARSGQRRPSRPTVQTTTQQNKAKEEEEVKKLIASSSGQIKNYSQLRRLCEDGLGLGRIATATVLSGTGTVQQKAMDALTVWANKLPRNKMDLSKVLSAAGCTLQDSGTSHSSTGRSFSRPTDFTTSATPAKSTHDMFRYSDDLILSEMFRKIAEVDDKPFFRQFLQTVLGIKMVRTNKILFTYDRAEDIVNKAKEEWLRGHSRTPQELVILVERKQLGGHGLLDRLKDVIRKARGSVHRVRSVATSAPSLYDRSPIGRPSIRNGPVAPSRGRLAIYGKEEMV